MNAFRFVSSPPQNAYKNMAVDEAIFKEVSAGNSPPTLRFYTWEKPSLSIGYFQNPLMDLNLPNLKEKNIPWVRRITGGRGIYHHLELTYSFSAPRTVDILPPSFEKNDRKEGDSFFPNNIKGSYHKISLGFLKGFQKLGLPVQLYSGPDGQPGDDPSKKKKNPLCFSSPSWYEIMVDGKKLAGSAQKRFKNGFLQQGTLLLNHRFEDFHLLFQLQPEDSHDFTGLFDFLEKKMSRSELEAIFISGFEEAWGVQFIKQTLSEKETVLSDELYQKKYSTEAWNLKRITQTG